MARPAGSIKAKEEFATYKVKTELITMRRVSITLATILMIWIGIPAMAHHSAALRTSPSASKCAVS